MPKRNDGRLKILWGDSHDQERWEELLENYQELFRPLTMANGTIKVFCEVADL